MRCSGELAWQSVGKQLISGGFKMTKSLCKVFLVTLFISVYLFQIGFSEIEAGTQSIKGLIDGIMAASGKEEKNEYLRLLKKDTPQTKEEKDLLIDLLKEEDADVKCVAMELLGKLKEKRATKKIIRNLKDKSDKVKITAATVLGEIGDERAIDALLEDSELMVLEFGQCPVAKMGAAALPKLADLAGRKSILGLLPKQDKKSRRSRKAATCIGQIRDEKAVPTLMKLLKEDDEEVKLGAIEALASMKVKEAEPEFEKMLNQKYKDEFIPRRIIRTLAFSNSEKYVPKIYKMMDKEPSLKFGMAKLLGELKEKTAVEKLEKLINDEDEFVRHAAAVALWRITGKVYKHKKGSFEESWDIDWIRRINDELERFRLELNDIEKHRASGRMNEQVYKFYKEHHTEEKFKKYNLENLRKAAQKEGALLEYNNIDEVLGEIKKNPGKYSW